MRLWVAIDIVRDATWADATTGGGMGVGRGWGGDEGGGCGGAALIGKERV